VPTLTCSVTSIGLFSAVGIGLPDQNFGLSKASRKPPNDVIGLFQKATGNRSFKQANEALLKSALKDNFTIFKHATGKRQKATGNRSTQTSH
jgi:hypothetical protein